VKITPQEILSHEFGERFKGFDKEEVKHFLMQITGLLEDEILEKEKLKKDLEETAKTITKYEKRESVLRDTLISAQNFSAEIKINAEREAELRIKEAEIRSEEIVNQAIARRNELKNEIKQLKFKRKEIETDILNLLSSLKEFIESYQEGDEEFEKIEYLSK
jgi:cell division initiation protein